MTSDILALSISNSLTKVGAIAGLAAVLGLAVLSLLYFAQARELKRLREWAGRAPERSAELEQRVTTAAAARVQQPAPAVRPIPRAPPISAGTPSAAPGATRAPGGPPAVAAPGQAVTAAGTLAGPAQPQAPAPPPGSSGL